MRKLSIAWTVKKIIQKVNKNEILFNHPIQRKSGQWTREQECLLIHSLLSDYPIPPLYAVKDEEDGNKYSLLDGKQRVTIIKSYMNDEWELSDDTPEVTIEGIEYEIAGLKFSELAEDLQEELKDVNLTMLLFEDCTDEEIQEIFYRLNNGTALTKDQKTRARLGNELVKFVDEIVESEFFKQKASFNKAQLKKAEDQTCVLQTLMLLTDYSFKKFGNDDVLKFVESYKLDCDKKDLDLCKNLLLELNKAFDEKRKWLKKIHIPMLIMTLKKSRERNIPFDKFKEWVNNFINTYDAKGEYASYCIGNTTNKEKVIKRLDLMYTNFNQFIENVS